MSNYNFKKFIPSQKFLDKFAFIDPRSWMRLHRTSKAWDKKLNMLLDGDYEINFDYLTCTINGHKVWTGNYPYSYGYVWENSRRITGLPKRSTVRRLYRELENIIDIKLQKYEED